MITVQIYEAVYDLKTAHIMPVPVNPDLSLQPDVLKQ